MASKAGENVKHTGELENKLPNEIRSQQQRLQSKGTEVKKAFTNTQLQINRREIKGLGFYEAVVLFENFLLGPPPRHSPNLMSSANVALSFMEKLDRN